MHVRRLVAGWVAFLLASSAAAQPEPERSNQLPPLLPVPPPDSPAVPPPSPGGPVVEYDPGYLYIPERDPSPDRAPPPRFLQRWWFDPSVEFAWSTTSAAPQTLKLRPPDLLGRTARLNVPMNGEFTAPFQFGFGLSVGRWIGEERLHAIESNLYVTGNSRTLDGFAQSTAVIFAQGSNRSAPLIVRFPEPFDGFGMPFTATAETTFVGFDLNYRLGLLIAADWRIDALAGYRYAMLEDTLYLGDTPDDESTAYLDNRFSAKNSFHGGQLGLSGTYRGSAWYAAGTAKLAYGGVTTRTRATGALYYPQPHASLGTATQSAFLPTFNGRVGVNVTERSRLFASYSFQYLSRVGRFGEALGCGCGDDSFWIQSVGLGLEVGY